MVNRKLFFINKICNEKLDVIYLIKVFYAIFKACFKMYLEQH